MSIKLWIAKKLIGKKSLTQGIITDEMREKANETRRMNYELRQAEKRQEFQKRLDSLESYAKGSSSFEETLLEQVLPLIKQQMSNPSNQGIQQVQNPQQTLIQHPQNGGVTFTIEQVESMVKENQSLVQNASMCTDDQIRDFVRQQIPNINEVDVEKFITVVRRK